MLTDEYSGEIADSLLTTAAANNPTIRDKTKIDIILFIAILFELSIPILFDFRVP